MKTNLILSLTITAFSLNAFAQEADFVFGAPDSISGSVLAPTTTEEIKTTPATPVVDPFAVAEEAPVNDSTTNSDSLLVNSEGTDTVSPAKKEPRHPLRKGFYFQFGAGGGG